MDYITRLKQNEEFEYWLEADNEQILYIENELNLNSQSNTRNFYLSAECVITEMLIYLG